VLRARARSRAPGMALAQARMEPVLRGVAANALGG
jgi:hypothetical protein